MEFIELIKKEGKCCATGKPMNTSKGITMVDLDYYAEWEFPHHSNVLFRDTKLAVAFLHDDAIDKNTGNLVEDIKWAVEFTDGKIIYHEIFKLRSCRPDAPLNPLVTLNRDCADILIRAYHEIVKINRWLQGFGEENNRYLLYRDSSEHGKLEKICIDMEAYQSQLAENGLNTSGNANRG